MKRIQCPSCNEPLSFEMVTQATAESSIALSLTPTPGEMFDIETVGGALRSLSKLLKAVGNEMGVKTVVMLKSAKTSEAGELVFDLVIARVKKK